MTVKMPAMTEDELLTAIVEAALFLGWRVHHDRRSDLARQQGSPGFPDLVLAKKGRVIFAELKTEKGRLTEEQFGWYDAIRNYNVDSEVRVVLIRPADLDAFLEELAR